MENTPVHSTKVIMEGPLELLSGGIRKKYKQRVAQIIEIYHTNGIPQLQEIQRAPDEVILKVLKRAKGGQQGMVEKTTLNIFDKNGISQKALNISFDSVSSDSGGDLLDSQVDTNRSSKKEKKASTDYCFNVVVSKQKHQFRCENKTQRDEWIKVLLKYGKNESLMQSTSSYMSQSMKTGGGEKSEPGTTTASFANVEPSPELETRKNYQNTKVLRNTMVI